MTAADTALRIVRWAATDMRQAMPEGDLDQAARLGEPEPELRLWVGRLAAVSAARLRLAAPPLGDDRPPGLEVLVLAAALGAHRRRDQSVTLLRAVRAPVRAADLLTHHGIAAPVLALLPHLADQVRDVSPLTGVLDRPGPRTVATCEGLVERLRTDPAARAMTILRFATPPDTAEQALWRGDCLTYIRHGDPDFVLDVYETAMLHFGGEYEIRARTAWRHVLGTGPYQPAVPTAYWWRALAELEDAQPRSVRQRPHLAGRRVGTNLFRRLQRLELA